MGPSKKKTKIDREFKGGAWDLRQGDRRTPKVKPKIKPKAKSKEPERRKGSRRRGFGDVF